MTDPQFFIYFHRRPDTGDVFYVGRGKRVGRGSPVKRAHAVRGRSAQWQSIVEKNGGQYAIEIVEWCDTFEFAKAREVFYIASIGRKCYGGPLINLSDGGDGIDGYQHTDETRQKLRAAWQRNPDRIKALQSESAMDARRAAIARIGGSMKGKRHSAATRANYSEQRKGARNHQAKTVVDMATGVEYGCVGDAARALGIPRGTLYNCLFGGRTNTTTLRYK